MYTDPGLKLETTRRHGEGEALLVSHQSHVSDLVQLCTLAAHSVM
jgi:phosphohistidine phosphatase SixA